MTKKFPLHRIPEVIEIIRENEYIDVDGGIKFNMFNWVGDLDDSCNTTLCLLGGAWYLEYGEISDKPFTNMPYPLIDQLETNKEFALAVLFYLENLDRKSIVALYDNIDDYGIFHIPAFMENPNRVTSSLEQSCAHLMEMIEGIPEFSDFWMYLYNFNYIVTSYIIGIENA